MKYKLENGKEINIDENVLLKSMSAFGISREEAIQLYLEDNDSAKWRKQKNVKYIR